MHVNEARSPKFVPLTTGIQIIDEVEEEVSHLVREVILNWGRNGAEEELQLRCMEDCEKSAQVLYYRLTQEQTYRLSQDHLQGRTP